MYTRVDRSKQSGVLTGCYRQQQQQQQQQQQCEQNANATPTLILEQSRIDAIRHAKHNTALRNARNASSTWLPDSRYPVKVLTVAQWDVWMSQTVPDSVVLASLLEPQLRQGRGCAMFVRIRILLLSKYHSYNVPTQVTHKSLSDCIPTDRLVDVGFVRYKEGLGLVINASCLRDGVLSVVQRHLYEQVHMYMGYPTSIHIVLATGLGKESQRTVQDDTGSGSNYLKLSRSRFNRMANGGMMVLFVCIEQRHLWNISTDARSYPTLRSGINLHTNCGGWMYVSGDVLSTNTRAAEYKANGNDYENGKVGRNTAVVRLSSLQHAVRFQPRCVEPTQAVSIVWFWGDNNDVAAAAAAGGDGGGGGGGGNNVTRQHTEVTLRQLENTIRCLCTLLQDFAHTRRDYGNASAPSFCLWYTRESRTWDKQTLQCINSPALVVARQLLIGEAALHSADVYELAINDWVQLSACALVCLLEQGDADALSYVVRTSRHEYAQWNTSGVGDNMTVDVLSLLSSAAGRRMLARRHIQPLRGRVKLSDIPELAVHVALENLENMLRVTCVTPVQVSRLTAKLPRATNSCIQEHIRVHLYSRTASGYEDIDDLHKLSVTEFVERHAGICIHKMLVGGDRLCNDARFRLVSVLYPYTKLRSLRAYMMKRLRAQWLKEGNGIQKCAELLQRMKSIKVVHLHKRSFLREHCKHPGIQHKCVYSIHHPWDALKPAQDHSQ
jgi:hypothetical protein